MQFPLDPHLHLEKHDQLWLISQESLEQMMASFGKEFHFSSDLQQEAETVFLNTLQLHPATSELHLLPRGGWEIKVSDHLLKTAFTTTLLSVMLGALGLTMLPGYVLPAVLPLLFDIEKITLTRKEEEILLELTRWESIHQQSRNPKELYAMLSEETQFQLPYLDFLDFVEKLEKAGFAKPTDKDRVILSNPDFPHFKLTFR